MLFAFYPDLDNIGSSANSRIDDNGLRRTVGHTGSTFHACIEINEMGPLITHFKNCLGADFSAQASANAFVFVKNKT